MVDTFQQACQVEKGIAEARQMLKDSAGICPKISSLRALEKDCQHFTVQPVAGNLARLVTEECTLMCKSDKPQCYGYNQLDYTEEQSFD